MTRSQSTAQGSRAASPVTAAITAASQRRSTARSAQPPQQRSHTVLDVSTAAADDPLPQSDRPHKQQRTDSAPNHAAHSVKPEPSQPALSTPLFFPEPPASNCLRILISTDNHLGFAEHDAIRCNDSFVSFKEMLHTARANHCDLVLLAGDLFHDNRPSRACLYRASALLREYACGSRPIAFECLSNPEDIFSAPHQNAFGGGNVETMATASKQRTASKASASKSAVKISTASTVDSSTACINYEDPNVNISLPIFSIHGNHDDPAGLGGYSVMDLLHTNRLVNYFGKQQRSDKIVNHPIMLRKGGDPQTGEQATKVAVYGLGNIRDERLHRTFQSNDVKWVAPLADDSSSSGGTNGEVTDNHTAATSSWFNICLLHQNRTKHSVVQKDYIAESMLPSFLDLVIWGHEHECLMEQSLSQGTGQAGKQRKSNNASAAAQRNAMNQDAGDANEPHQAAEDENMQTADFTIIQPGSSVATSLSAGEAVEKHIGILEIQADQYRLIKVPLKTVRPFLLRDVRLADELDIGDPNPVTIEKFLAEQVEDMLSEVAANPRYSNWDRPKLPLIRLRVEHTGFPRISASKFGQKFVGKLANPEEVLHFHRQRAAPTSRNANSKDGASAKRDAGLDLLESSGNVDETPPIHELVSSMLSNQSASLSILRESQLAEAVQNFVDKRDVNAILAFVETEIKQMQIDIKRMPEIQSLATPTPGAIGVVGERNSKSAAPVEKDAIERLIRKRHEEQLKADAAKPKKKRAVDLSAPVAAGQDSDDEPAETALSDDENAAPSTAAAKKKRGAPAARGRKATTTTATGRAVRGRKATTAKAATSRNSRAKREVESSASESDGEWQAQSAAASENSDDDGVQSESPPAPKARGRKAAAPRARAAAAPRGSKREPVPLDVDQPATSRKRAQPSSTSPAMTAGTAGGRILPSFLSSQSTAAASNKRNTRMAPLSVQPTTSRASAAAASTPAVRASAAPAASSSNASRSRAASSRGHEDIDLTQMEDDEDADELMQSLLAPSSSAANKH